MNNTILLLINATIKFITLQFINLFVRFIVIIHYNNSVYHSNLLNVHIFESILNLLTKLYYCILNLFVCRVFLIFLISICVYV